jgi:spermidine synthase
MGRKMQLWVMVWLSGFACLIYQVLWMRQLGLMLGNTSQAAALTLAVFFAGLAFGSWFWGRKCARMKTPLRTYAWLECGIAASGLLIVFAPEVVNSWYLLFSQRYGDEVDAWWLPFFWTWLMVFSPAMLMGGTLPVLGQVMIHRMARFGMTAARLYTVNTMGAACGAFATAFVLIAALGIRLTCATAMVASMLVAAMALYASRGAPIAADDAAVASIRSSGSQDKALPRRLILLLAFVSGFQLLALEVIWTRMLAQVHENSVYSFSATLIVVLVALAMGAWLASRLARADVAAPRVLMWLMVCGATLLLLLPFVFLNLTDGGMMLATDRSFAGYVSGLLVTTFATIGPSSVLLGAVFPMLMKCEERHAESSGQVGNLSAINTIGAIAGSLIAGFLLLEYAGIWRSLQGIAAAYLLIAFFLPVGKGPVSLAGKYTSLGMLVVGLTVLSPSFLPQRGHLDHWGKPEIVLDRWESSDATVTVVKDSQQDVSIKINSAYSLGSTSAYAPQIQQARLPLLVFPKTDSLFFLGMGTGITAGESLDRSAYPWVSRVVTCELSSAVVAASRKYFAGGAGEPDITQGLYTDPRSQVVIGDGRHRLMASEERFAMINADLFLPYGRGTGNLYSREHFAQVLARLKPGGVFVQWLPLYQISEKEFGIIARTMLAVFPQVSLWRGNFQPGAEMAALVGHADETPLQPCDLDVEDAKLEAVEGATHRDMHQLLLPINEQTALFFYGGNVTCAADEFRSYELNTDDRPVIEFGTPRSLHRPAGEGKPHFVQERFAAMIDRLQRRTPPASDPLLRMRRKDSLRLPLAGAAFYRASIASISGDPVEWSSQWEAFLHHWLNQSE